MNVKVLQFIRRTSLVAPMGLVLAGVALRADTTASQIDAFPTFQSYIKISGQAPAITGDKAAFQARTRQPENGGAGIEDFFYAQDLSKDVSLQADGHAMVGTEDYLGELKLTKNDVGAFEAGYKRFRTFYDGIGGFFPLNQQWAPLTPEELHTDRSKFWVAGTINLPNLPVLTIRYTNELRDGQKDSTIWGDSDFTGLPNNVPPISQVRKLFARANVNAITDEQLVEPVLGTSILNGVPITLEKA